MNTDIKLGCWVRFKPHVSSDEYLVGTVDAIDEFKLGEHTLRMILVKECQTGKLYEMAIRHAEFLRDVTDDNQTDIQTESSKTEPKDDQPTGMSRVVFLSHLKLMRSHDETTDALYKLGVDIIDSKLLDNFYKMTELSLNSWFNEEQCDVILDYIYTTSTFTKDHPYITDSKTNEPIVWDDDTLCDFLELT